MIIYLSCQNQPNIYIRTICKFCNLSFHTKKHRININIRLYKFQYNIISNFCKKVNASKIQDLLNDIQILVQERDKLYAKLT